MNVEDLEYWLETCLGSLPVVVVVGNERLQVVDLRVSGDQQAIEIIVDCTGE